MAGSNFLSTLSSICADLLPSPCPLFDRFLSLKEVNDGAFQRTLQLPEGVKANDVQARYHDGVLEITMLAPATLTAKKAPIEIAGAAPKQIAA